MITTLADGEIVEIVRGQLAANPKHVKSREAHAHSGRTYVLGELFAGAGGMALGAHQAALDGVGYRHAWASDKDGDACETFRRNLPMEDECVLCGDVKDLDLGKLSAIDGLAFGFPCNDFSVVNDREGIAGKHGGLYRWGIRCLKAKEPLFFVAENVSGLASSGNDLKIILSAMEDAGYEVFAHTYKFEEYGVPQTRRRIVLVGFRRDLGIDGFDHPEPTTKDKPVSCREALRGIQKDAPNNEMTRQSAVVVERLRHIGPGENAFTARMPDRLRLNLKSGATISQIYRRLKPNEPAYTVTGSGGGGTHVYHWKQDRALTNRERARLQSFPDDFVFFGGKESVRRQIGMAVPPEGARQIFVAVLKTLLRNKIESQC